MAIFLTASVASALAQKQHSGLARGGGAGIYIELGRAMVSKEKPYLDIERYLIERREEGGTLWKEIASVSAPTRYDDFLARLAKATLRAPEPVKLTESELKQLWAQLQRSDGRVDSVFYVGLLPIRLAVGLAYLDTTAKSGEKYVYRVSTMRVNGTIERSVYSTPVSFPEFVLLEQPKTMTKQYRSNEIVIRWMTRKTANVTFLAFRRVGFSPFVPIEPQRVATTRGDTLLLAIRDTLVQPNLDYAYFIVPQDFYGNVAITSDTAEIITSSVQDLLIQNLKAVNLKDDADSSLRNQFGVKLSWTLENIDGVKELEIYRSDAWEGEYERLAAVSPKSTHFIDVTAEEMKPQFYQMRAIGFFGEKSRFTNRVHAIAQNPTPPSAPSLEARATPNGIELLLLCDDDVAGYRIYRAGEGDSLSLISSLIPKSTTDAQTIFLDSTVKGDSRIQTYAARSESKSFVMSAFSETVIVKPKSDARPKSPMNLSATLQSENGRTQAVRLFWEEMSPFVKSAQGYRVMRREANANKPFEPLHEGFLPMEQNHFLDTTLSAQTAVEYAVALIDEAGTQSEPSTTMVQLKSRAPLAPPSNVRAMPTSSGVVIRWDEIEQENLQAFAVYRYEREQSPIRLASVSKKTFELVDSTAQKDTLYFYFVKSVAPNGEESRESEEVGIRP